MTRYSRKKGNNAPNRRIGKRQVKTKNRIKDIDEIHEDLKPENLEKLVNQEVDLDVPGAAQFYCVQCARYFVDDKALGEHKRSKVHKRRLKELEYEPYSQEESERASGMGSYLNSNKRRKVNDEEKG